MATTAGDIIKRARLYLNDANASADVWSDTDRPNEAGLITILGDAIREIEAEMRILNQKFFVTSASIGTTSGTELATLPSDFVDLILLERNYDDNWVALSRPDRMEPLATLEQKNRYAASGSPKAYMVIGDNILWAPIPSQTQSGFATLWYVRRVVLPTSLSDTLNIPDDYIELAAISLAMRARIKLDMDINSLFAIRDRLMDTLRKDASIRNLQEPKRALVLAQERGFVVHPTQPPQG